MSEPIERRDFLGLAIAGAAGARLHLESLSSANMFSSGRTGTSHAMINPSFPRQDPAMVEEMVFVSHNNLARVKQLVDAHPALSKASVDWGFGDWEDALGAASHIGRVDIAEYLLAHGARPTIFSAAMLGHLDTVKAFVTASPGCQRILGPHGIPLLAHARAGGERASATLAYLEQLGDANIQPTTTPLDPAKRSTYAGSYVYGAGEGDNLQVALDGATGLTIIRPGMRFPRGLRHLGNDEFYPQGAEFVRIRFKVSGEKATTLEVLDPDVTVTGTRQG